MMEHRSLFYNLNYPSPTVRDETPSGRLDASMNKALEEGWVPYAAIPASGDPRAGYILMTRCTGDTGDLVEGLFGRRQA